jgi:nucleotide-binding universal stress UspA family protein
MRDVLVHVRDLSQWGCLGAYATDLAAHINGSLTCVYVEPVPAPIAIPGAGADVAVAAREGIRLEAAHKERAARGLAAWATAMGARQAAWQVAEGDVSRVLGRMSAWHDLIIIDRNEDEPLASVRELGAIIVASRAPVIVLPKRRREAKLDCIALAWNHSDEALAAIHAARPLLAHATRIVILEGGTPDAHAEDGWNPKFDLQQYLQWQGFRAEREAVRGESATAGEMLVQGARRQGADLLVMGAYGRSRLSEWALGGATRSVLFDASLPVFLKH